MSRKNIDMTEGTIWKQLLFFAFPLLLGNVIQQFYNTADSIVVGNFVGAAALGAVTSVTPAINTLIGFFSGLATGAGVVISQYFGAKKEGEMRSAIHTSIVLTFLMAMVMTVLGITVSPYLLNWMHTPPEIKPLAEQYLKIYFAGIVTLMFYNMGSGILRAVGDSKRPLYFIMVTSVLNVVLDLVFVVFFRLGVAGVAIATVFSQLVSDIAIFVLLLRTSACYRISMKELRLNRRHLKRIVALGIPVGIQMSITAFSNGFVQSYINFFGASATAGWGVFGRVDSFVSLPMQSISIAVTTFAGQNAGAGNTKRIKKGIRTGEAMSIATTISICTLLFIFAPLIVSAFNRDSGVLYYGTLFLRLILPFDFICCYNQIHAGVLRGVGNTRFRWQSCFFHLSCLGRFTFS
jgi:putative efflux protein, MATE family